MRPHECHDFRRRTGTGQTRDLAPAMVQDKRRNPPDPCPLRHRRMRLRVQFRQPHRRGKRPCRLREFRRHHAARTAPRRPVIDQQRKVVTPHRLVMRCGVQFVHPPVRQRRPANPAFRTGRQPCNRHTVRLPALRTAKFHRLCHSRPRSYAAQPICQGRRRGFQAPARQGSAGRHPAGQARRITAPPYRKSFSTSVTSTPNASSPASRFSARWGIPIRYWSVGTVASV